MKSPALIANPDDIPSRYESDVTRAARRAVRMAGARAPLQYIGLGMTGVVFCDRRDIAFKVARKPNESISRKLITEEANWLRVASTVPSIRGRVARFRRYHRSAAILERECVHATRPERRPARQRWDIHREIESAMLPYGYTAPEYKDDSYVFTRGRGWVLVDASMPSEVGSRLAARAAETLRGKRFLNERPSDLAFQIRMESGRTLPAALAQRLSDKLEALPTRHGVPKRRDVRRGKRR